MNPTIAFYCSSTSWGGLEMNTLRYSRWLSERGWQVKCFFVRDSPLWNESAQSDLHVLPIKRNRKYFDFASARQIAKRFREEKIDIVWYRDNRDLDTLAWAKVFSGNNFKIVYHQAMQLGVSKRDFIHTWRFKKIDAWIATLNFLAEQVKTHTRFPSDRIHVIPLGLETARFTNNPLSKSEARRKIGIDENGFWIGLVGRIDPLKGQDVLLDAFVQLHLKFTDIKILFVGESTRNEGNAYELALKKKVADQNLGHRVFFKPFMHDIENFYRAMDVFVLASAGETFGMVTIEAMASGCAIVGTDSSGTPEILENGQAGLLFEPGNVNQLAGKLAELVNNEPLRMQLKHHSAELAGKRYSHQHVLELIQKLLLQL